MALPSSPLTPVVAPQEFDRNYRARWSRLPANLGYLLPGILFAVAGLTIFFTLFSLGISLIVLYIGIFILSFTFTIARWWGHLELARLERTRGLRILRPAVSQAAGPMTARHAWELARDPHSWGYLLYAGVVQPILGIASWTLTITALACVILAPVQWLQRMFWPSQHTEGQFGEVLMALTPPGTITNPELVTDIANVTVGLVILALLPVILDGLVGMHLEVAKRMLSRYRTDDLVDEVNELSASRQAAVAAENAGLRRLERDIHDGPQQRLIRIQMDLAAAERMLDADPERAAQMLSEARGHAGDTLNELRALARGFAPPLLQDRGLRAALVAIAAAAPVPTSVVDKLPDDFAASEEVELGAYFVVAELLANAGKHAAAESVTVILWTESERDAVLAIRVTDDGRGGAQLLPGHGLAGLEERIRGLRGSLNIHSPEGGPTIADVRIPLPVAASVRPSR